MNKADVLIIGSGVSSLTCAALLAKKGKSVIVLEQYSKPGGYLHCFSRFGLRFDTGAHYVGALGQGQPFHSLLSYLDLMDDDLFIPLDPTGFDVFHFPNYTVQFPKGYEELISHLSSEFPTEKTAIRSFFEQVRKAVTHFPTYEFEDETVDIAELIQVSETPLSKVVSSLTSNLQLQCLLYGYCSLHGVAPDDVPFGFHAIVMDSLIRGPYGLRNGGDTIARKFVQQIEKQGGKVLTKSRVVSLRTTGKLISEVITQDGSSYVADWVISGIHPKATFGLVSGTDLLTPAFKERIQNLKESVGIFGIYAACKKTVPLHSLRNYYFFKSTDPRALFEEQSPTSTPEAIFLSSANRSGEGGKDLLPINIHAPGPMEWFEPWRDTKYGSRPEEYRRVKDTYAENVLRMIDQHYAGFRDSVTQFATSSPLTNLHFNGSAEGSSYGIYHSIQNTGARALGPRTKIHNLLLTGQNCLFPGLLGAAISALRTSGHIVGIKPILGELKKMRATE